MIKAVLFDLDGCLIDSLAANNQAQVDLLTKAGYPKPTPEELLSVHHNTLYDSIRILSKETDPTRVDKLIALRQQIPYPSHLVSLAPHAQDIVAQLAKTYQLGIVSGRTKEGVDIFYQISGLKKHFSAISTSDEYQNPKPHPEPVLLALKKLQVDPKEAVYIGDSQVDYQSATAAGAKFIGYAVRGLSFNPDHFVTSLLDLPDQIKHI